MTILDVARERLRNQRLTWPDFKKPADVVKWLGAVQAQDYNGAKWALGQRMHGATDAFIERAFAGGAILRTHVMRPTWHFVTPADIRWMLSLTAPRVNAICRHYYSRLELDEAVFKRSNKALASALRGGKQLTREALRTAVQRAGIVTDGPLRFLYILARAELDAIICSGARKGKQFTYALLDERVPKTRALTRDEALAELTRRYFRSHGPATVQDFVWWSGLTASDAKAGLEMVQRQLVKEVIDGKTYWLPPSAPTVKHGSRTAYLLPTFDEYLIAYKDRSAVLDPAHSQKVTTGNLAFVSPIVLGGRVVGNWKRSFNKGPVIITLHPFAPLGKTAKQAITDAARRYGAFLEMPVEIGQSRT